MNVHLATSLYSYYFSQWQLHSSVHLHCAVLHEHLPLHSPLNSCSHISPFQCKLLRPMEGLFTQETICILCSISSHILLDLVTPAELYIAYAPNATSLVGDSSTVLQQGILCWWNCFHCSIFWQNNSFRASLTDSGCLFCHR